MGNMSGASGSHDAQITFNSVECALLDISSSGRTPTNIAKPILSALLQHSAPCSGPLVLAGCIALVGNATPTAAVAGRTERVTSLAEIGKLPDTKAPEGKEGGSVHYYEYGYYSYYTDDEEGAPGSAPAARKTSTKAPMPAGVTDVRTATKPSLTNMLSDRAVKVTMTEGSV